MNFGRISVLLSVVLLASFSTTLQAQTLETKPRSTGLALEVVFLKGVRPAFQTVPWTDLKGNNAWYARFGTVGDGKLAANQLPVRAVRVVPFVEGVGVRVKVSVLRGKFMEVEDHVASHLLAENERVVADDLRQVGVVPFELRLFRLNPTAVNSPRIIYRTKSVEIVSVEPLLTTLPAVKLTIHNSSDRAISALGIEVHSGGRMVTTSLPQGKEGQTLIPAGGFGEVKEFVPVEAKRTAEGYDPAVKSEYEIVITGLVFDDGNYEGSSETASSFRGFTVGRKLELARLSGTIQSALESIESDGQDAPTKFLYRLNSLGYGLPEDQLTLLERFFPTIPKERLRRSVEIAMHGTRKQLIGDVKRFLQPGVEMSDYREWLGTTKTRYDNWLARL